MNAPLFLVGDWNEPFLLVACLGNVLLRCDHKEGANLADCAVWRDEKHLRLFDTKQQDTISKMVTRFREWARAGFDQPFGVAGIEAAALYAGLRFANNPNGPGGRANIDAIIKRWVLVDIIDPGMPIEVAHFDAQPKRVRPRTAHNLPRDVRQAVDAYLLAYEPGHARAYVHSWRATQEITT